MLPTSVCCSLPAESTSILWLFPSLLKYFDEMSDYSVAGDVCVQAVAFGATTRSLAFQVAGVV